MLDSITSFFDQFLKPEAEESPEDHEHTLRLATAALLLEVSQSDSEVDERETQRLIDILETRYQLEKSELEQLLAMAREEARDATSLYQFTRLFNDAYDYEEKVALVSHLWEIAYADGNLDRYEEHLIRRVADLLYLTHSDYIRTKLSVRDQSSG